MKKELSNSHPFVEQRQGNPPSGSRWLRSALHLVPSLAALILAAVFLVAVAPSLATSPAAPNSPSTSLISYQGHLIDSSGVPVDGQIDIEFSIYDVATGGTALWQESWTGANGVSVSDGTFHVMLGSLNNTLATAIQGFEELYLGITVGSDGEMNPRVQMGSVPFAMHSTDPIPAGAIIIWTGTTCPTGYTRASSLDGKFLRGAAAYGGTGGAESHSHTTNPAGNHSHSISTDGAHEHYQGITTVPGGGFAADSHKTTTNGEHNHGGNTGSGGDHTHGISSGSNLPPYTDVIFCQKN